MCKRAEPKEKVRTGERESDLNSIAGEVEGRVSVNDMPMVRSWEVVCRGSS